jgi:hypothetical protein
MKTDSTNTLILIALVVAGGAYWYFFTGTSEDPTITSSMSETEAQSQFQVLMSALPVSFETSIFEDPRFQGLVDISTSVTPEPSGRPDPFAPLTVVPSPAEASR